MEDIELAPRLLKSIAQYLAGELHKDIGLDKDIQAAFMIVWKKEQEAYRELSENYTSKRKSS